MNPKDVLPENILPHRGRMLLIDEILELDDDGAVTRSVVTEKWPFFNGRDVNAIVLIELVAQTAGIHNGWIREKLHGPSVDKKGWIVGIRQVRLAVNVVPLGTGLIARTKNQMEFEGFRDIAGTVEMETQIVAEIAIQLLRSDATA